MNPFATYKSKDLSKDLHYKCIKGFGQTGPGQTAQTQIRLLLMELSDQDLLIFSFHLHLLGALLYGKNTLFKL